MAEDVAGTTTVETETETRDEPVVETRPEPSEADRLRDENARLREDLDAARRRPEPERPAARPAADAAEPDWSTPGLVEATQAEIDKRWQAGEIDDARRSAAYSTLATRVENFMDRRRRAASEATERTVAEADRRLAGLFRDHPDLKKRGSALLERVSEELGDMERLGFDPGDKRTQVIAAERAVKQSTRGEDDREYERRRRPVGGGGGGSPSHEDRAPKGKSKGESVYGRLNDEAKTFYRDYHGGDLTAIYKTLDHADEALLARKGRFR